MPGNLAAKPRKQTARKTAKTPRAATKKQPGGDEGLGPERRVELARLIEARQSRGRPPSI
jgi:hypothetical protein